MAVYADDMNCKYGRMIMSHMLADTEYELHEMADAIGIDRKHHQCPGGPKSHYDICFRKKALALRLGAIPITIRQAVLLLRRRQYE